MWIWVTKIDLITIWLRKMLKIKVNFNFIEYLWRARLMILYKSKKWLSDVCVRRLKRRRFFTSFQFWQNVSIPVRQFQMSLCIHFGAAKTVSPIKYSELNDSSIYLFIDFVLFEFFYFICDRKTEIKNMRKWSGGEKMVFFQQFIDTFVMWFGKVRGINGEFSTFICDKRF